MLGWFSPPKAAEHGSVLQEFPPLDGDQITVRFAYAITSHLLPASANSTCTRA